MPEMFSKEALKSYFDSQAATRARNRAKHRYFYRRIEEYLRFYIPPGASVLVVGCGSGELLKALQPARGVGVDISEKMIEEARRLHPEYEFHAMDAEELSLEGTFDVVIVSEVIGYLDDIQRALEKIRTLCRPETRVMITYYNIIWRWPLKVAESMGLKMRPPYTAWLAPEDIANLMRLAGFEIIRKNYKILCPVNIPLLAPLCNFFLANIPGLRKLSLLEVVSARLEPIPVRDDSLSVTVLIPARNERGNIEAALRRTPKMGSHTEIIFVEGGSSDGTWEEIQRQIELHPELDIKAFQQTGKGKGDAVRTGYARATGDVLMILDADLTVPPEDLPKFFNAIATRRGEFINGTRLVYPMEDKAMRFLNVLGNKFFSVAFTYLLEQRFKDTLCGTKVMFRRDYLNLVANRSYFGNFDPFGDFDLLFGAAKLNLKIVEVPIRYRERVYGDTNISRFRHGFILLKMCIYAFRKIKMI